MNNYDKCQKKFGRKEQNGRFIQRMRKDTIKKR